MKLTSFHLPRLALLTGAFGIAGATLLATPKHSPASRFPSYDGRVMCGYQGWFRAEGDGSGDGWVHFGTQRKVDSEHLKIDLWPDVSEYPQTYATELRLPDGTPARLFSSWDKSTIDVHFRWMEEYGIDGVFMQRFFGVTRTPESRAKGRVILGHALEASQAHDRAIAVMYDLSGLRAQGEDCSSIIQDWKELVDELKLTSRGAEQTYLYHRGRPLVAIWGLGFPDRPYNIRHIGLDKLIDFLRNDPVYGGCSILLGVPAYFRDLKIDTLPDPWLHEIMRQADVIMPWTVQRFTPGLHQETERYAAHVAADLAWCTERKLDYAPCVYPGFSWYNLTRRNADGPRPLDQIPREGGRFYWDLIRASSAQGAKMLYVAMFDEVDEGTAIFKCSLHPPVPAAPGKLLPLDAPRSDHYLRLTGLAGKMIRHEIPATTTMVDALKRAPAER